MCAKVKELPRRRRKNGILAHLMSDATAFLGQNLDLLFETSQMNRCRNQKEGSGCIGGYATELLHPERWKRSQRMSTSFWLLPLSESVKSDTRHRRNSYQCSGAVLDVRMLQQIRSLRALLRILPETGHDEIFAVVRGPSREVEFLLFGDLDQQLDESCSAAAERIVTQKTFCENQTSSPDVTLYTVFFTLRNSGVR